MEDSDWTLFDPRLWCRGTGI